MVKIRLQIVTVICSPPRYFDQWKRRKDTHAWNYNLPKKNQYSWRVHGLILTSTSLSPTVPLLGTATVLLFLITNINLFHLSIFKFWICFMKLLNFVSIGWWSEAACCSVGPAGGGVCWIVWTVFGVSTTWVCLCFCWCWWCS